MNEFSQMIEDTSRRIFTDLCDKQVVDKAEAGQWPSGLWNALEENGLTLAGIPEQVGGSGGTTADSLLVIREAARAAAPLPLAETFLAADILASLGVSVPPGPLSCGMVRVDENSDPITRYAGEIPFAAVSNNLVLIKEDGQAFLVPVSVCKVVPVTSFTGEPVDEVSVDLNTNNDYHIGKIEGSDFRLNGARVRAMMLAGAMESALEMAIHYAQERNQFGRSISKFQAIQHQLATMATEVAAASRASDMLLEDGVDDFLVGVAKARIGEAAGVCASVAHQVHGAIGYTLEHALNHRTRRMWAWRDEFGNETEWNRLLGQQILSKGADQAWPYLASI